MPASLQTAPRSGGNGHNTAGTGDNQFQPAARLRTVNGSHHGLARFSTTLMTGGVGFTIDLSVPDSPITPARRERTASANDNQRLTERQHGIGRLCHNALPGGR